VLLENRVAVVTGAGRGIGRAVAELFVENGARVLVNDVDLDVAEETALRCRRIAPGDRVAVSAGSVTDGGYVGELMARGAERFGGIDILVNNAGITRDAVLHRMTDEDWGAVLDVNLTGAFLCLRSAAPYLRDPARRELETEGEVRYHRKVVNFFSTAAIHGNAGQANYAAAKMGNVGLTRALAREWAPFRINVNAVAPGFTDTRLTQAKDKGESGPGIPADQRDAFLARLPFGRPAQPLDVAKVVLFLASPLSDWVTGQEINVSGGHQIP